MIKKTKSKGKQIIVKVGTKDIATEIGEFFLIKQTMMAKHAIIFEI